ncbi:hypothetical protein CL622_04600 [archaeon]|nr:hypothetical protein [archaeon]
MRISKKQLKLIELVEKCNYLLLSEINKQEFPDSMINALINKGLLFEHEGAIASATLEIKM